MQPRPSLRTTLTAAALLAAVLPAAAHAQDADLAAYADRWVIPPVVASGWTAPGADAPFAVTLRGGGGPVVVEDGTLRSTAPRLVTVPVTATLSRADGSGGAVTKRFEVTVLPEGARRLVAYTRTPVDRDTYSPAVAYSMHMALEGAGEGEGEGAGAGGDRQGRWEPLNRNRGILYAHGVPTEDVDILDTRTLRSPHLFYLADGTYGILATRTMRDGSPDPSAASSALLFTSPDLRTFREVGTIELGTTGGVHEPRAVWDSARRRYLVSWADDEGRRHHTTFAGLMPPFDRGPVRPGDANPSPARPFEAAGPAIAAAEITGAEPSSVLPVPDVVARGLEVRFGEVVSVDAAVPDVVVPRGVSLDLDTVTATVTYSDGSTAELPVAWNEADAAAVDRTTPGRYTVRGTIRPPSWPVPFIPARADPTILEYDGAWYFIATDDTDGGHVGADRMTIRRATTLDGLAEAEEHTILTTGPADIAGCFWAPELHAFAGTLHVFFAPCIGEASWSRVQAHVLELEAGGAPTDAGDWLPPRPVLQADGSPLQLDPAHPGISLDMTYFEAGGTAYVAWSQRYIVDDLIGDAEIWIATVDPADPYRLTSEPRTILSPDYGWDRNLTAVVEGPFVTVRNDTVHMVFSGSAVGPTYATGLATAPADADLTAPAAWTRLIYPILETDLEAGQWGPGHGTFTRDREGRLLFVFHLKTDPRSSERHTAVRWVHWSADGLPVLEMMPEDAAGAGVREVAVEVEVR